MRAAGHPHDPKVWVENILSVPPVRDSIINDERHHNIPRLVVAKRDILTDYFLPGSVAIDSIPGLTSVMTLVLARP